MALFDGKPLQNMRPHSRLIHPTERTPMKVVMEKDKLLSDLVVLQEILGEYDALLARMSVDVDWQDEALDMMVAHKQYLAKTRVSLHLVELVNLLLDNLLQKVKVDNLTFRLQPPLPPRASTPLAVNEEAIQKIIQEVNAVVRHAPLAMQERIRYLLLTLSKLFKALMAQDKNGVEDMLNQVNLLTSTRESQTLVREIALIAKEIYTTLNSFTDDIPLDSLNESADGMSEAVKKINGVIGRLEAAAFQNLETLEKLTQLGREDQQLLDKTLKGLRNAQTQLGNMKTNHPHLAARLSTLQDHLGDGMGAGMMLYLSRTQANQETYMSMLASQSFQDLTGQTLKKIITFIESLELQMIKLLQKYKPVLGTHKPSGKVTHVLKDAQESPLRQSQTQVDDLMAELGF